MQEEEPKEKKKDEKTDEQVEAKKKMEFKNVSQCLIDLIENPNILELQAEINEQDNENENDDQTFKHQIESLVYGHSKEGCFNKKIFGYLLAWSCMLSKIDLGNFKAQLNGRDDYTAILATISEYLEQNKFVYQTLLVIIVAYLPKVKRVFTQF